MPYARQVAGLFPNVLCRRSAEWRGTEEKMSGEHFVFLFSKNERREKQKWDDFVRALRSFFLLLLLGDSWGDF